MQAQPWPTINKESQNRRRKPQVSFPTPPLGCDYIQSRSRKQAKGSNIDGDAQILEQRAARRVEVLTGDPPAVMRCEKRGRIGNVVWLAYAAKC